MEEAGRETVKKPKYHGGGTDHRASELQEAITRLQRVQLLNATATEQLCHTAWFVAGALAIDGKKEDALAMMNRLTDVVNGQTRLIQECTTQIGQGLAGEDRAGLAGRIVEWLKQSEKQ